MIGVPQNWNILQSKTLLLSVTCQGTWPGCGAMSSQGLLCRSHWLSVISQSAEAAGALQHVCTSRTRLMHACSSALMHACSLALMHACSSALMHACSSALMHACGWAMEPGALIDVFCLVVVALIEGFELTDRLCSVHGPDVWHEKQISGMA